MAKHFCWAQALGNCAGDITREHVVSRGVFPDTVTARGFHWCRDEAVTVGSSAFVAKILCVRHNSALSDFDTEAIKFFAAIERLVNYSKDKSLAFKPSKKRYNINGLKLERWLLKTLLNYLYYSSPPPPSPDLIPLLKVLYEGEQFAKPYGLHAYSAVGKDITMTHRVVIAPLFDQLDQSLVGGIFEVGGICFGLHFPSEKTWNDFVSIPTPELAHLIGMKSIWHIESFSQTLGPKYKLQTVKFHW